jgi:hypothetical protein
MIDLKIAFDSLKAAAGVAKDAGKIELWSQILELQQSMIDANAEIGELKSANRLLSDKVAQLEHDRARRDRMSFHDETYWDSTGQCEDGPFCPKCLDGDGKYMRMIVRDEATICVGCNLVVRTPGYTRPVPRRGFFEGGIPEEF